MSGYGSAVQRRPDELVDILRADFQHRNEPNFAWKSAISAGLALPVVRAFWPMSSVGFTTGGARDISGEGYHLTNVNSADFGYDNLIPCVEFNGTTQYLTRASAIGNWATITGLETFVKAGQLGLSLGGWFNCDALAGVDTLISKHDGATAAGSSYQLRLDPAGTIAGRTYLGAAGTIVTSTNTITATNWFFAGMRFVPSATIDVYLNGTKTSAAHAHASINDTAAPFSIGTLGAGVLNFLDGKASQCFLCACLFSDALFFNYFQQTRAMFGV